jgi:hypothetical protein
MLQGFKTYIPLEQIAHAIWLGNAIISTDSSVQEESSTYAIVILINLSQPEPTLAATIGGNLPKIAEYLKLGSH